MLFRKDPNPKYKYRDIYPNTYKLAEGLTTAIPAYKKYTPEQFIDMLQLISNAETGNQNIAQMGGGPGRGFFQMEGNSSEVARNRAENIKNDLINLKYKQDITIPEFNKDFTKLSKDDQAVYVLSNMIKAASSKRATDPNAYVNPIDAKNSWLNYHWAGKAADRPAREKHWNEVNNNPIDTLDDFYKQEYSTYSKQQGLEDTDQPVNNLPRIIDAPGFMQGAWNNTQGGWLDKFDDGGDVSMYKQGGLIKRADGSYSRRGLWDNIRANRGSGRKPTAEMLRQERKIKKKEDGSFVEGEGEYLPIDPRTGLPVKNLKGVEVVGQKDYGSYIDQLRKDWANTYNEHPIMSAIPGTNALLTLGNALSTPQKSLMYALTGRYDTPSNINPTRGLGNFQNSAMDVMQNIVFDPLMFLGAVPEAKAMINASKESGLLSNAYKYNPWAFKPNPEAYYRGIGKTGLDDAIKSKYIRGNPEARFRDQVFLSDNIKEAELFSKGYIAEIPKSKITEYGSTPMSRSRKDIFISENPISLDDAKLYKQDWLRGYKEVSKKEDGGWVDMYAEGDIVTNPTTIQPKLVNIQDPKTNTITQISSSDSKYKEMYPNLMNVDEQGNLSKTLPEVEVKVRPNVSGCVAGMCYEMGENSGQSLNDFRHRNNLYGDSWNLLNNAYGTDIKLDNKDFSNLKVNDVVNLTRDAFDSDAEKGIPATNQHVGFISKIVDGVPYVKHFIGHQYYEEPINDINAVFKYQPTKVKRLADYQDLNVQPSSFKFDQGYEPNNIEEGFLKGSQQKPNLQKVLSLNTDDYDNLEKLAYGIMYNEGKFGRSKKTLYRMVVPDFLQKAVKVADDIRRGVNVYDENINNLSQGYSSTKESTLHGVSKTDKNDKRTPAEINKAIKEGDYSGLERTNNYLYYVLGEMGLNTDNLENGENSYKAVMANLSWLKKRYPGATNEALLKMYTGKKNVSSYEKSVEKAQRNIDNNPNNNLTYSAGEKFYGALSNLANKVNSGVKTTSSKTVGVLRDAAPTPITVNALLGDIAGSKEPITEKSLSNVTLDKLKEIVKNQVSQGKYTLDYNSYFPELSRDQRLGVSGGANDESGVVEKISRATSPGGMLQNFLGQANIVDLGNGEYEITDSYDFNDKGKSFGVMDDLIKRGASPYAIPRAIGRNFGSQDNQGAPVKIRVKLENGGFIQSYGQGGCCNGMYGNGSTVTTNKPPQKTLKQALLDYKENADENKWEFIDISGLTSWDDAARGYDSWQKSGRTLPSLTEGMDMFSAIPVLGKAKQIEMGMKEAANAAKGIPWGKIYGAVDYLRDEYNDKIKKKDDGSWVTDSSLPTPTTPSFYPAGQDRTLTNYQMGTPKAPMYAAGSTVWTNQDTPLYAAGTPTPTSTQNFRNTGSLNPNRYLIGGKDIIPTGMNYKTPAAGTYDYNKDVQPYHTMRLHAPDTLRMDNGGHTPIGGLWDTNRKAFVDSTLQANTDKEWIRRLYNNNAGSIQVPGEKYRSTHLMSNDNTRVYPEIQNINGKLTYLPGDQGYDYADKTKSYINFNYPKQADWFASNGYKIGTNVLNSIDKNETPVNNPNYVIPKHAHGGHIKKHINSPRVYGNPVNPSGMYADGSTVGGECPEGYAKNRRGDCEPIEGATTQFEGAQDYFKGWFNSPIYKQIIQKQGEALYGDDEKKKTKFIDRTINSNINNWKDFTENPYLKENLRDTGIFGVSGATNLHNSSSTLDLNFVKNNPTLANSLYAHELAHRQGMEPFATPYDYSHVKELTPAFNPAIHKPGGQFDENGVWHDRSDSVSAEDMHFMFTEPDEVRTEIHAVRQLAKQAGVYDPYTESFTKEHLDKIEKLFQEGGPDGKNFNQLGRLRKHFSDESVIDMMNTISQNNNQPTTNTQMAKRGGYVKNNNSNTWLDYYN